MAKKRVVLTGAGGYVAQRMIKPLQERYDLVCLDVVDTTRNGEAIPNVRIADLTNGDRDAYRAHFRGADAILHCAFVSEGGEGASAWRDNSDAKFLAETGNIQMVYNVYKTAQEENVKRVVSPELQVPPCPGVIGRSYLPPHHPTVRVVASS